MPRGVLIRSTQHAEAVMERDSFLSTHPELKPLQNEIDKRLQSAVSDHNRLVMVHDLMMEAFLKLDEILQSLAKAKRDHLPEDQSPPMDQI